MTTKEKLAEILDESGDEFISGSAIADKLGITRAAVWKNIRQLVSDGCGIEAVPNRGYRLTALNDYISAGCVEKYLGSRKDEFPLEVLREVDSTNEFLKKKVASCFEWHTVISGCQSAGKGRSGRSFYSPKDSGIYLSMLLRPRMDALKAARITCAAAVAACGAIEECTDAKPKIKWVNDVFVNDRKVCGILTEASVDMESGGLEWAVVGVGFNVYEPEGGFPEEIAACAGAIEDARSRDLRCALAAAFMKQFRDICSDIEGSGMTGEYRKRSFITGRNIEVIRQGGNIPAYAAGIDDECRLLVRYADGTEEALVSGEVSIRPAP